MGFTEKALRIPAENWSGLVVSTAIVCSAGLSACSKGPVEDFQDPGWNDGPTAPLCDGEVSDSSGGTPLTESWFAGVLGSKSASRQATTKVDTGQTRCQYPGYYGEANKPHRLAAVLSLSVGIFDASGIQALDEHYDGCAQRGLASVAPGGDMRWLEDSIYYYHGCDVPDVLTGVQRIRQNSQASQIGGSIERVDMGGQSEKDGYFSIEAPSGANYGDTLVRGWISDQPTGVEARDHSFEFETLYVSPEQAADHSPLGMRGDGSLRYQSAGDSTTVTGRTTSELFNRHSSSCFKDGVINSSITNGVQFTSEGNIEVGDLVLTSPSPNYPGNANVSFNRGVISVTIEGETARFYIKDVIDSARGACGGFYHDNEAS